MLLYLHKIDSEWMSVSAEYYETQARYADERKVVGINAFDQIPDYVGISPDELVRIKSTLADEYESAKYLADIEYEVECIANGANPLDSHRHC